MYAYMPIYRHMVLIKVVPQTSGHQTTSSYLINGVVQLDSQLKKKIGSKHYTINQEKLQADQSFKKNKDMKVQNDNMEEHFITL